MQTAVGAIFMTKKKDLPLWQKIMLYVVPGMIFSFGVIVPAVYGVSKATIMNSLGVVLFTSCVFGTLLMEGKAVWQEKRFWVLVSVGALIHVCACISLFRVGGLIPSVNWFFLVTVELCSLIAIRRLFLYQKQKPLDTRKRNL